MRRLADSEIAARLKQTLGEHIVADERAADAADMAILKVIEHALRLQEADDLDSPADDQVLKLLKEAKAAQEADLKESKDDRQKQKKEAELV